MVVLLSAEQKMPGAAKCGPGIGWIFVADPQVVVGRKVVTHRPVMGAVMLTGLLGQGQLRAHVFRAARSITYY